MFRVLFGHVVHVLDRELASSSSIGTFFKEQRASDILIIASDVVGNVSDLDERDYILSSGCFKRALEISPESVSWPFCGEFMYKLGWEFRTMERKASPYQESLSKRIDESAVDDIQRSDFSMA